jgi:heme oxygenase
LLQGRFMTFPLLQPDSKPPSVSSSSLPPSSLSPNAFLASSGTLCGGIALPNEGLSQRLLRETSLLQSELDGLLLLLVRPATEQRYRAFCSALWGFHAPLEQRLHSVSGLAQTLVDLEQRRKTELLELDLAQMGVSVPELELRVCKKLPALPDEAHALGACHVLEVCALGYRHLQRYSSHMLPSLSARASHFLTCYGERTEERWAAFTEQLRVAATRDARAIDAEAVLEGAVDTLVAARNWFQSALAAEPAALGQPRSALAAEGKRPSRLLGWSEIERAVLRAWPQLGLSPWSQPELRATPVAPWGSIESRNH